MSLTTYNTNEIINSCPMYEGEKQRSRYITPWTSQPKSTYNIKNRCRKLREKKSLHHPLVRGKSSNNIYNYRTPKPRRSRRISRIEPFTTQQDIRLVIVAILILICFIKY